MQKWVADSVWFKQQSKITDNIDVSESFKKTLSYVKYTRFRIEK